ncbi:MAG: hypothetical protein FWE03_01490 [Firmicutes bacterium]|nr:hypothetical protein [Bacillota bacterium]
MDFISYLRRVIQDVRGIGNNSAAGTNAANTIRDFIRDYDTNHAPRDVVADVKTDDEIRQAANAHYQVWRDGREQTIQSDFNIRSDAEEFRRNELQNERDIGKDRINNTFDERMQRTKNDNIRRGLARSSIADNRGAEVENERIKTQHFSEQSHLSGLERIDQNLRTLEQRKNAALNDLDNDHARRIETQIGRLENERQRRIAEAERANAAGATRAESEAFRMQRSEAVFLEADQLLSQMTPAEARAFMRDDVQLRAVLSSYHYMRLRNRFA